MAAYEQVRLPSMSHTVHLILDLEPDTKYEVKARMYSNAGIGPFSEPQIVKTDVGKLSELFSHASGLCIEIFSKPLELVHDENVAFRLVSERFGCCLHFNFS